MSTTYLGHYFVFPNNVITEKHLKGIPGNIIHGVKNKYADLTYEQEFDGLVDPNSQVIKMSKKKYIDSFFESGFIQLGTISYYRSLAHSEQGDGNEGSIFVIGRGEEETGFAQIKSGFNYYLFCCSDGSPDSKLIDHFSYDDYFIIEHPQLFMEAIGKTLNANNYFRSRCLYKTDKVLIGDVPKGFNFNVLSSKLKNMVAKTKYFIKTKDYEHQKEYRFIWETDADLTKPLVIQCPEAVKYCRRE